MTTDRVLQLCSGEKTYPRIKSALTGDDRFHRTTVSVDEWPDATIDLQSIDCLLIPSTLEPTRRDAILDTIARQRSDLPVVLLLDRDSDETQTENVPAAVDEFLDYNPAREFEPVVRQRILSTIERRRLQREVQHHTAVLEQVQELADIGGWEYLVAEEKLHWTEQVYEIHDLPRSFEPTVESALSFYHSEDRPRITNAVTTLIDDGVPFDLHLRLTSDTDAVKWVRVVGDAQQTNGQADRVRGVIQDITMLVDSRSEAQKLRDELIDQQHRIETLGRILAHELRNPLAGALGQLELYRTHDDDDHLDAVERNLDRIETSIDDTLWLVKGNKNVDDVSMVDARAAAREAWSLVETGDRQLETEPFEKFPADPTLLRTVFEKLFQNVIDHSTASTVRVVPTYEDGDLVGFVVVDDGDGLSLDDPGELFGLGTSTSQTEAGIGLSVVDQIVARHGWTIRAGEDDAGGTRFDVHIVDPGS